MKDLENAMIGGQTNIGDLTGPAINTGYYYVVQPFNEKAKEIALRAAVDLVNATDMYVDNDILVGLYEDIYQWFIKPDKKEGKDA